MGGDHGGGKIIVAEQVLNGADVSTALQQVRGKGMPARIATLLIRRQ